MRKQNRIVKMGVGMLLSSAPILLYASDPSCYPISAEQVAQALSESGMQVKPADVSLGVQVVASKMDPEMYLLDIQPATSARDRKTLWARIGCKDSGVCLPFYATVAWDRDLAELPKGSRPGAQQTSTAEVVLPPAIHSGTHATLVIASDHSRLTLAVVALQNGSVGEVIRVASPDHKQFYRAEVVSADLLKGTL